MKHLIYILFAFALIGCGSTKHIEQTNYRDSIITHIVYDTINVTITDTVRVEAHSSKQTEDGTEINFGQGGGTYNSKTGEATNVSSVKQSSKSTETEDMIREQKTQIDLYQARCDSLTEQLTNYESSLEQEKQYPKRTGWDRFCTWWFIITALLLLVLGVWKGYKLYLKIQSGGIL